MMKVGELTVFGKTHFFISSPLKDDCPRLPFTQLYSGGQTEYVQGVLHTDNSKNFCQTANLDLVFFDRISAYNAFFQTMLKDAKTCPPKKTSL